MNTTTCDICVEKITSKNKIVTCIHCQFESCIHCSKTYILGKLNDAECMSCKKVWNREFLTKNFTRTFFDKEYKKHRENVLFDRQMSMMQETQNEAEKRIQLDKVTEEIQTIKQQINILQRKAYHLEDKKWKLRNNISNKDLKKQKQQKQNFYGHCPEQNCRGFITSKWECGICETKVCKSCKEKVEGDEIHTCDENTIKNIELLKKDTKPCPNCKVPINRLSGCRQMWCVVCHIAYDWKTGEIVKRGAIHNPHFFEWQNGNGADLQQNNNACGRDQIARTNFYRLTEKYHDQDSAKYFHYFNIFLNHCDDIERRKYQVDLDNYEIGNYLELRIQLLLGKMSEKDFKIKIQRHEKSVQKKYDIFLVVDMLVQTGRDILDQTFRNKININGNCSNDKMVKGKQLIENLIQYTNKSLLNMEKIYKNKIPKIVLTESQHTRWSNMSGSYIDFKLK